MATTTPMSRTRHLRRQRRRVRLDRRELDHLLAPTATISERVKGLLGLGLPAAEIAKAVGVGSTSTLRNWATGDTEPRADAVIALDDLRVTATVLLDGGLEPERAVSWLLSRDPKHLENERPIDIVRTAPMKVLAAAHDIAIEDGVLASS